ncbi:hypothetical protein [Nocardia lijiangensis]|uniref:hypothetical protein n=1 Tax=Nocardia lijiangensis TaxID=299618 RepID=UPI003D71A16C
MTWWRFFTIPAAFCAAYPFLLLYTDPDTNFVPYPWDWRTVALAAPLISVAVWFRFPRVRDEAVAFTAGVWALTVFFASIFLGL